MALEVQYVNNINVTPGYVTLAYTPVSSSDVAVDPDGGPAQVLGVDYVVIGNRLYWDHATIPSSDIKGVVGQGKQVDLRIVYERI